MPVEILLCMTQYLPLESVVSLSLVSKSLLAALPLQVSSLKDSAETKQKIIDLLSKEESLRTTFAARIVPKSKIQTPIHSPIYMDW